MFTFGRLPPLLIVPLPTVSGDSETILNLLPIALLVGLERNMSYISVFVPALGPAISTAAFQKRVVQIDFAVLILPIEHNYFSKNKLYLTIKF